MTKQQQPRYKCYRLKVTPLLSFIADFNAFLFYKENEYGYVLYSDPAILQLRIIKVVYWYTI